MYGAMPFLLPTLSSLLLVDNLNFFPDMPEPDSAHTLPLPTGVWAAADNQPEENIMVAKN